jgi:hypothetical protein
MSGDAQVLLWIAGVHLLGLGCIAVLLFPAMRDDASNARRSDGESDDGWGRGPKLPPLPPSPPRGGIPLRDADQSRVRLRERGRLGDLVPRRERRPTREPTRRPQRTPHRSQRNTRRSQRTPHR